MPLKKNNQPSSAVKSINSEWDSFLQYTDNIILFVNKQGIILNASDALQKKEEMIGKSAYEFFSQESEKKIKKAISAVTKTTKPQKFELISWGDDKGLIYYSATAIPYTQNKKTEAVIIHAIDITEKIAAKDALEKSEEKFRKLSDSAFEGIAIHQNGKVMEVNKTACIMFGYKEKEIIGRSIADFVHPNYLKTVQERIQNEDPSPYEIIMLRKGNVEFWVELLGNQIIYNGFPARVAAMRDITTQKESENKISESERKFSVLSNNFPGIAYRCLLDDNLTMQFLSDGFLKLTGYTPKDFINNNKFAFNDIIHPDDRGNKNLKKALKGKKLYELEYRIVTADKEIKWVWEKGQGVFDKDGKLLFLEGFIADINDKKHYELELKNSRENYKSLIDNSPDGIIIYVEGRVKFANKTALAMLEANEQQVISNSDTFYLLPEYHQFASTRMESLHKGESVPYAECKMKTAKGKIIEVESKPTLVTYNGEDATLVVMHDTQPKKQLFKEQLRAQIAEETNEKLQQQITERKKAERILQSNQKYTRLLIESSLDMICATDIDGNITEFNLAAQQTFGYKPEEVLGKHVSILYSNHTERTYITEQELLEREIYVGEVLNVKKNGKKFISFLSASVLKNEEGEIVGAMGVSRDISESKKAEQELRDSEERYRAIYNQAYIGIAKISLQGQFLQVNEQLCSILGYTNEELCQKVFIDITAPEDMKLTINFWDKFLKGEIEKATIEKKYLHKSGKIIYTNLTISMVKDSKGNLSHFISVFQDITERRKAEKEQHAQAAKLNAVFEAGSHLVWTTDKDFCLTSFNKNFKNFIQQQYKVPVSVGTSMIKGAIVSTDEYNDFWKKKNKAALSGIPQYFETNLVDDSGNDVWYEIFLNPIYDENQKIVEVSGIGHDITEKILADEKIRQSLKEKEVLLKEVHHRVKNNLQVISSILNLQSSYVKDQNTLNILRESQNRIKSMAFIHESLYQTKDFSNINFSEYVVNLSQNLIHTYSNSFNEIKLKLDVQTIFLNLDLAIPSGLIINEIVSNAIKYAFVDNNEENTISIVMHPQGDNLKLIIEDNGIGLPEHIDFRNTESLGLQLVITLIDQLNGNIQIDNTKGTKYTIIFKLNQTKNRI